jgi:hypothetical protein
MASINEIALQRAITVLDALKADYYIKHGDLEFGNVIPAAPEKKITRAKRQPLALYYLNEAQKIEVGGTHKWSFEQQALAERVRSALTAYASKAWGAGSYISTMQEDGGKYAIEILRVS